MVSNLLAGAAGGAVVAITIKAIDEFSNTFKNASGQTSKLGTAFKAGTVAATALTAALVGVTAATVSLAKSGAEMVAVQSAFNNILGAEAQKTLNGTRDALKGTVSDFEIMKNANLLFQNVGTATAEQMTVIAQASRVLGKAVGVDTAEAFDRLTLGIAKGETELLDELGLKLDATTANRLYAESIGKTVGELTAEERATAALNAIIPKLQERIAQAGDVGLDFNDQLNILSASFDNLKRELGVAVIPVAVDLANVFIKDILPAIKPLIPLIGQVLNKTMVAIVPVIQKLAEILVELTEIFLNELFPAIEPMIPELQEFTIMVLDAAMQIFRELVPSLKVLLPIFIDLLKALMPLIPPILQIITGFAKMANAAIEFVAPAISFLVKVFEKLIKPIEWVLELLGDVFDIFGDMQKQINKELGLSKSKSKIRIVDNSSDVIRLNDFIMTPTGKIIEPSPQDTIIGTKGGVGNTFVFNIERIQGTDPEEMMEAFERYFSRMIRI